MRKAVLAIVASLTVIGVSFGLFGGTAGAQDTSSKTIVEIAQGNPDLSTLVTAVTKAGLADTLSGPGPFTVFAPTNAAFSALPKGTLDSLKHFDRDVLAKEGLHGIGGPAHAH